MGAFAENVPPLTSSTDTDGEDNDDGEFTYVFRE